MGLVRQHNRLVAQKPLGPTSTGHNVHCTYIGGPTVTVLAGLRVSFGGDTMVIDKQPGYG